VRAALDQPVGLQPVGDAGHVRVVAVQPLCELAHRQRLAGLELLDRDRLLRRQPELLRDREHPAALREEQVEDAAPRLLLRRLAHAGKVAVIKD